MERGPQPQPHPPGSDTEDAKRKKRAIAQGQKACNPCRLRKVRCSYQTPCQTCVDRQHPELCNYDAPLKRVRLDQAVPAQASSSATTGPTTPAGLSTDGWLPSRSDWDSLYDKITGLQREVKALRSELARKSRSSRRSRGHRRSSKESPASDEADFGGDASDEDTSDEATRTRDAVHAANPITGETIFLGGNSVAAMAMALGRSAGSSTTDDAVVRDLLDKSILPVFNLDNESATYPFVDLWGGLPHASADRIEKLCGLLPSDSQCLQYLRQYRDTAHVLFPGIVNMQQFEAEVTRFLVARTAAAADPSQGAPLSERDVYGRSVHWLGLFFACLASGCQCSDMLTRRERQLTSQVYICCAYESLRVINYLSCSQLEDIQTLLVLGNVISNNMSPGVSWALLGLTIRLAQGLGLNQALPQSTVEETTLRHEIWSRIIWQDSLLSISYDRATPTTSMTRWHEPHSPAPGGFQYIECMLRLCSIALDVVSSRATRASTNLQREARQIEKRRQAIAEIDQQAHLHLRALSACASMRDYLEYWNWHMHRSYIVSELCRPTLAASVRRESTIDTDTSSTLRAVCIEALADTVDAFLNLYNLTAFARTSWAAVHRSISSALLLGIVKEPARSERVWILLDKLIGVLSSIEYSDLSEMPAPVSRAVAALVRLNVRDNSKGDGFAGEQAMSSSSSSVGDSPHAQMQRIMWGLS